MYDFTNSLVIVIVIYNVAIEDCESFQSVFQMIDEESNLNIFIYDNSEKPQVIKEYEGLSICYIHDSQNPGVSKAYNTGAFYAQKENKKWILLLDQDTILPNNILESYQKAITEFRSIKLFVPILVLGDNRIFSPCKYKFKRGFHLKEIKEGVHSLQQLSPVNSGMLIAVDVFIEVGGYNDKVKLDFSDFQFIERFRKKYSDFYVLDSKCQQDFSDDEVSYDSQMSRFKYYCNGAKNIEKYSNWEKLQYLVVVGVRALTLTIKYKKLAFISSYYAFFLNSK